MCKIDLPTVEVSESVCCVDIVGKPSSPVSFDLQPVRHVLDLVHYYVFVHVLILVHAEILVFYFAHGRDVCLPFVHGEIEGVGLCILHCASLYNGKKSSHRKAGIYLTVKCCFFPMQERVVGVE